MPGLAFAPVTVARSHDRGVPSLTLAYERLRME